MAPRVLLPRLSFALGIVLTIFTAHALAGPDVETFVNKCKRNQTNEDATVPAENAVSYFLALRKAGVPAEMHVFERGPHGVGLANADPALSESSKLLANWLRLRGLVR